GAKKDEHSLHTLATGDETLRAVARANCSLARPADALPFGARLRTWPRFSTLGTGQLSTICGPWRGRHVNPVHVDLLRYRSVVGSPVRIPQGDPLGTGS